MRTMKTMRTLRTQRCDVRSMMMTAGHLPIGSRLAGPFAETGMAYSRTVPGDDDESRQGVRRARRVPAIPALEGDLLLAAEPGGDPAAEREFPPVRRPEGGVRHPGHPAADGRAGRAGGDVRGLPGGGGQAAGRAAP